MPNSDLLPSLLFKINENQQALEAAIMELTLWIEQRGSGEIGGNVRGALDTIRTNEEFIHQHDACGAHGTRVICSTTTVDDARHSRR
jgi:hypothetical protein